MSGSYRIAVIGATGVVGAEILARLDERRFPAREVVAFASERSAGRTTRGLTVQALSEEAIEGFDLALFSAGSAVSRLWAPRFVAHGAVAVDNSSAWRLHPDVPLVVAEVNPEALDGHHGIVANPNCTAMQSLVALKPIADEVGLERVVISSYQAVSGTGRLAVEELRTQARAVLAGQEPPWPTVYPHPIAFNVVPQVETFLEGDDYTTEERKVIAESRKILGLPELRITATCARVPVFTGHSESINVQTLELLSPSDCRAVLAAAPGVQVRDNPRAGLYPLAVDVVGQDDVFVGRIRIDESAERTLNLWVVGDNLRKGAATNAVQLAELLASRGLVEAREFAAT